jgi:segregation and condensation protein A
MHEQIFEILLKKENVSWRTLLHELVKSENMDPWDINLTTLTQKYLTLVKKMKEHDLLISGKVILAAAILLKIKSHHFIDNDIANLDRLFNQTDEEEYTEEDLIDEFEHEIGKKEKQQFKLIPRNPQPRSRKVSIHDLVQALQHAMESKKRTLAKQRPVKYQMPKRGFDIMEIIHDIYHKVSYYSKKEKSKEVTFSKLLPPRAGKIEKVHTFIPLLHLENQQKLETKQTEAFGEIYVKLMKGKVK